jgi:serralysin
MASIQGNAFNNDLRGGPGDDVLYGYGGADTLDGGGGFDRLSGGTGDDLFILRDRWDLIYESTGIDTALVYEDFVKPAEGVEQWRLMDGAKPLPYWLDALVAEDAIFAQKWLGAERTIYFHFPESPLDYFTAKDLNGWKPLTAAQKALILQALDYIESVINIRFMETSNPYQPNVMAFSNNTQSGSSAYARFPSDEAYGSDVFINATAANLNPGIWSYAAMTLIHEIGHALGLKHPFDEGADGDGVGTPPYLPTKEDDTYYTVMSYNDKSYSYKLQFAMLDMAALQYLYGPSEQGIQYDNQFFINPSGPNFIGDGGGADSIHAGFVNDPLFLSLQEGDWSWVKAKAALITDPGQITINIGTQIESALLGPGSDTVIGNDLSNHMQLGAGSDVVDALAGDDRIWPGSGNDTIFGGSGIDEVYLPLRRADVSLQRLTQADLLGRMPKSPADASHEEPSQILWVSTDQRLFIQVVGAYQGEGTDYFLGVEKIVFSDQVLELQPSETLKSVDRLYRAAFARSPDEAGMGYWLDRSQEGAKLRDIAEGFVSSAEFLMRYGTVGSSQGDALFVQAMYQNVLGRQPDPEGFLYWTSLLAGESYKGVSYGKLTPADLLYGFSQSTEFQQQLAPLIEQVGIAYVPWNGG